MRIFIDTNVFIDYLSHREPFFEPAALILQLGKRKKCQLMISALSFATASFILQAHYHLSPEAIASRFAQMTQWFNITAVDSQTIQEAIAAGFTDFEDAMQYSSARRERAELIITRNKKDFAASEIPVLTPREFLHPGIQ